MRGVNLSRLGVTVAGTWRDSDEVYTVVQLTSGKRIAVYADSEPPGRVTVWSNKPYKGDLMIIEYSEEGYEGPFHLIYRPPLSDYNEDRLRISTAIAQVRLSRNRIFDRPLSSTHNFGEK